MTESENELRRSVAPCEVLLPSDVAIRVGPYTFGLTQPTWVVANIELVALLKELLTEDRRRPPVLQVRPLSDPSPGTRRQHNGKKKTAR